ncbi:MAG TPA: TonB-dependent receptor [bacterium]|nr:TonB-dependent receptor [bacterium]HPR86987.1 TonB-dependent receptor [bacterium]
MLHTKIKSVAVLMLLASKWTAGGVGGEIPPDSIRYHLDPVVVTAAKIDESQREIAASITVLEQASLAAAPSGTLLGAIQQRVPGLFVTERAVMGYGVSGGAGAFSIRGVGGSPVTGILFLRDGRPDMMGLFGHPLPDTYDGLGVERVEVLRGPASFLYGTNAMGGIINLISRRRHEPGFETSAQAAWGAFATRAFSLAHGGMSGRWDYYLTAATSATDGHRDHSGYQGEHYTLHSGYHFRPGMRLELNANLANIDLSDPGPVSAPAVGEWYDLRRRGADLSFIQDNALGELQVKLHGNYGRHRVYDGFRSDDFTWGMMVYQSSTPWRGITATLGVDWKRYGGSANNVTTGMEFGSHAVREIAPYLHLQQLLFRYFIVSAGLRAETHSLYGSKVLPKVGLVCNPSEQVTLRFSAAAGFRSPTIRELYLFPAPTPGLEPESMWNYEMALAWRAAGKLRFEGVLFRSEGENLIRVQGRWPALQLRNSGRFTHSGYEISASWLIAGGEISAAWSKLDPDDQTMYSPGKKLSFGIDMPYRRLHLTVAAQHILGLHGADYYAEPLANYTLVDAGLQLRLTRHAGVRLLLKNAFDSHYATMTGYPMPGRHGRIEWNYTL